MNGAVIPTLAKLIVAAEEQASPRRSSRDHQNDILKEFMVRNTYIYPAEPSMRIVPTSSAFTAKQMPRFNSISNQRYHMQEPGATQVQELAFTLADGARVRARGACARARGRRLRAAALLLWAIRHDFFMEIAKMRAGRLLWAKLMSQFSPKDPRSSMLRTHSQTFGREPDRAGPYNNVIRTTDRRHGRGARGTQVAAPPTVLSTRRSRCRRVLGADRAPRS